MNKEPLETKTTCINGIHHCRLIKDGVVIDEMACKEKEDVSFCFRYMFRMYDKTYGDSPMADASRHRGKNHEPKGVIRYPATLRKNYRKD